MAIAMAFVLAAIVLAATDLLRVEEARRSFSRSVTSLAGLVSERLRPALAAADIDAVRAASRSEREAGQLAALVVLGADRRVVLAEPSGVERHAELAMWPTAGNAEASLLLGDVPVQARFRSVTDGGRTVGGFWLAADRRPVLQAVHRLRVMALLIALGAVGACVVLATMAAESLVRPLDELGKTVALLGRGELQMRHLERGPDEIRRLARRVNRMAEQLQASREGISRLALELDAQVRERTFELAEANRNLTELAHTDPLTGLTNRRGLEIELERYLALCTRSAHPLAVIMMDLDRFKSYNDTCGHLAGDVVLRAVGKVLRGEARASDVVARWGGDEFCILVPAPDIAGGIAAAQRYVIAVLDAMQELPHPGEAIELGASAGVACYPNDGADPLTLIARADDALYHVKATGGSGVLRLDTGVVVPPEEAEDAG
jgi:diguanylate cyclase (GGDEF)-like protein